MRIKLFLFLLVASLGYGAYPGAVYGNRQSAKSISDDIKGNDNYAFGFGLRVAASNAPEWEKSCADYECDGVNDEVEINAAIDRMIETTVNKYRGTVYLSTGNFYIGDSIDLYKESSGGSAEYGIAGQGMNATYISLSSGANCNAVECIIPSGSTTNPSFLEVRDLVLAGTSSENTSGTGIFFDNEDVGSGGSFFDANFTRVMAIRFAERGMDLRGIWGYKITNCITEICGEEGLYIGRSSSTDTQSTQSYITDHFSAYNDSHGIEIELSNSIVLNNLYVYTNGHHGIYLNASNAISVSSSVVQGFGDSGATGGNVTNDNSYGVYFSNSNRNIFTGIYIGAAGEYADYGIFLNNADDNVFSSLSVYNAYTTSIMLNNSERNVIGSATIDGVSQTDDAIVFRNSSFFNKISDVQITGQTGQPVDILRQYSTTDYPFGNILSNVYSTWGSTGETYDIAVKGNEYRNCDMHQSADNTTTTIYPQGFVKLDTNAGAIAATVGDGVTDGDRITLVLIKQDSGGANDAVITITSHATSSPEVATFDAENEYLTMEWNSSSAYWTTVESNVTF